MKRGEFRIGNRIECRTCGAPGLASRESSARSPISILWTKGMRRIGSLSLGLEPSRSPLTTHGEIDTLMDLGDDHRMDLADLDTRARFGLPDPPDPIDHERSGEVRTERVLIIEDDPDIARFIEVNLSAIGFSEISIEGDGDAGLKRIKENNFDLVVCNFVMPGLSGDEVVQRVRADARTRDLPVVMLTAQAGARYIGRAMEAGADDYITKPFDPVELLARIQAVLRRRAS